MTDQYNKEELQHFFGPQRRSHVWGARDVDWATKMMEHYQHFANTKHDANISTTISIPQVLHFIWLGPRDMPNPALMESWRMYHTDWQIQVWTNSNLPSGLYNQQAFDYALQHALYGMASDILRCEVLYKYGGVHVDVDYLCLASLAEFASLEFYCGASHAGCIEVNNGILASIPHSPIIEMAMQDVYNWFEATKRPLLLVSSFMGGSAAAAAGMLTYDDVCRHTGPGMWTRMLGNLFVNQQEALSDMVMVFPYSTFHGMPNTDRHLQFASQDELIERYAVPNSSKAIHLWHCTWQQQGTTTSTSGNDEQVVH